MELAISLIKLRDIVLPKDRYQLYTSPNSHAVGSYTVSNYDGSGSGGSGNGQAGKSSLFISGGVGGSRSKNARGAAAGSRYTPFRTNGHVACTVHTVIDKLNHQTIVIGRTDGSIIVYRTYYSHREETTTWTLYGHTGSILALTYAEDLCEPNGVVFSASVDGTIKAWDLFARYDAVVGGSKKRSGAARMQSVARSATAPLSQVDEDLNDLDGEDYASAKASSNTSSGGSTTASMYDPLCIQTLVGHDGAVLSLSYAGGQLISSATDGRIIVWENRLGRTMLQYPWLVPVQVINAASLHQTQDASKSKFSASILGEQSMSQLPVYVSSLAIVSRADRPIFFAGDSLGRVTTFAARPCIVPARSTEATSLSKSAGTIVNRDSSRNLMNVKKQNVIFSGPSATRQPILASRTFAEPHGAEGDIGTLDDYYDETQPQKDLTGTKAQKRSQHSKDPAGQLSARAMSTMQRKLDARAAHQTGADDNSLSAFSPMTELAFRTTTVESPMEPEAKDSNDATVSSNPGSQASRSQTRTVVNQSKSVAVVIKFRPISRTPHRVHKLAVTNLALAGREQVCISLSYDGSARGHDARTGLPVFTAYTQPPTGVVAAQLPSFTPTQQPSKQTSSSSSLNSKYRSGIGTGNSSTSLSQPQQPLLSGSTREELTLGARFTAAAWVGSDHVQFLLLGDSRGRLHAYSLADGACLKVFVVSQTSQPVLSMTVRSGGRIIITTPTDCCEWQLSQLRSAVECLGHRDRVIALAVTGGGATNVPINRSRPISLELPQDPRNGSSTSGVLDLYGSGDLYSASLDGEIRFWDLFERACLAALVERQSETMCMIHLPFTVALATGHEDGSLKLSKSETATSLRLTHHRNSLTTLSYVFDWGAKDQATFLLSGSYDGTLAFWPVVPRSHRYSPEPEFCIMASNAEILSTAASLHSLIADYAGMPNALDALTTKSAALTTIQQQVLARSQLLKKRQFQLQDQKLDKVPTEPSPQADKEGRPDFLGDAFLVASGGNETVIRVWCAYSRSLVSELYGHSESVTALAFDGHVILSGSEDCTVRAWCALSGKCLAHHTGHSMPVTALAVIPGSGLVASCSTDGSVVLWSYVTGQILRKLSQPRPLYSIAFSRATRQLLVGCDDGPILVFDVSERLLTENCSYAKKQSISPDAISKKSSKPLTNPRKSQTGSLSSFGDSFELTRRLSAKFSESGGLDSDSHLNGKRFTKTEEVLAVAPPPMDVAQLNAELAQWQSRLASLKEATSHSAQQGEELKRKFMLH